MRSISGAARRPEDGTVHVVDRQVGCGVYLLGFGLLWGGGPVAMVALAGAEGEVAAVGLLGLPILLWGLSGIVGRTDVHIDGKRGALRVVGRGLTGRRVSNWGRGEIGGVHVRATGRATGGSEVDAVSYRWVVVIVAGGDEVVLEEDDASLKKATALALAGEIAKLLGVPCASDVEHEERLPAERRQSGSG